MNTSFFIFNSLWRPLMTSEVFKRWESKICMSRAFQIGMRSILGRTSQRLPLRILDLEFVYQNPLRTSRDDPWDH